MHTAGVLRHSVLLVLIIAGSAAGGPPAGQPNPEAGESREIYLVPFSHLDLFWGGTREECLARGNRIIAKAVKLAKEHPEFRFLIEDNVFVANYVDSHHNSQELEEFKRLVKEGRIEIAPKWAAIYQNLPNGEALVRNLVHGKRYARAVFGVDPQVAFLGDLPGYTPQFPQILAKAGIPFMVMTRMGPGDKSLFYWKAPDGSRALAWSTAKGYGWGARLGLHTEMDEARKSALKKDVEDVQATTSGPILMTWGSDLWAPNERIVANVEALNTASRTARLILSTPINFFERAAKLSGVPEVSGEIPSSWPNLTSSVANVWPLTVPATNTLLTAEKFAAINYALGYADYPQQELDFLWRKLLEAMDHNQDGQGGTPGDDRKIGYSQLALLRGGEILRDSLRNIAERVQTAVPKSHPIVVFNPLGWQRSDLVRAHVTLYGDVAPSTIQEYRKGMRLLESNGTSVRFHVEEYSENISRALQIAFVAEDVPPLGYKTYYLVPAERNDSFGEAAQVKLDRPNDQKEPRRPLGADLIENQFYRLTVDKATGRVEIFDKRLGRVVCKDLEVIALEERGGNYIGIEPLSGRSMVTVVNRVELEENNPVRTVLKIAGQIIDVPVVQKLILYHGLPRVDVENTIEWKTPRFIRIQQLFPLVQADAQIHYGIPFGANWTGNIIPNSGPHQRDEITKESWRQARQIQDWLFAGNNDWGVTIAADHQLVRLNGNVIRGEMLRGTRFTSVKVVRGDDIGSMHYPPPGAYQFRYSLSSGRGDWKTARSYRAGMDFNNPLIPVSVVDDVSGKSLPPSHSFCSLAGDNLVLSALKKSDLERAIVLRFYEIKGLRTQVPVEFLGKVRGFRETNLLEDNLGPGEEPVLSVNPYEIKTIKIAVE